MSGFKLTISTDGAAFTGSRVLPDDALYIEVARILRMAAWQIEYRGDLENDLLDANANVCGHFTFNVSHKTNEDI